MPDDIRMTVGPDLGEAALASPLYGQQEDIAAQFTEEQDAEGNLPTEEPEEGHEEATDEQQTDFQEEPPPEDWPEELQAQWSEAEKRRIGDYTRKTQGLAQQRKNFEAQKADLERKAQQYDLIMSNPEFIRKQLGIPDPSAQAQPQPNGPDADLDPRAVLQDEAYGAIRKLVVDELKSFRQTELGALDQYQGAIDGILRQNVQSQFDALTKQYPKAKDYENQIAQFVQKHGVTDLKQAFFAVAGDAAVEDASQALLKRQETATRRAAQLPPTSMSHGKTVPRDKPATLADAFIQVAKEAGYSNVRM